MFGNVYFAFGLTLFAGLSTGIGSALAFFTSHTHTRILAPSLGFSAGVMIYVSFMELLATAQAELTRLRGATEGGWFTILGFFAGIALIAIIDRMVPEQGNPHEIKRVEAMRERPQDQARLLRLGLFTAGAIALHNFPEGFATFIAALKDPALGVSIAIAIAIHNIPEGIAVAVPLFYATGSRKKAFGYSFLSGLAEPVGALVGYLILLPFLNDTLFALTFAFVAGIMVFISLDELLPAAEEYGEHHLAIYGLIAGMAVMAASLLWLQ